MKANIKFILKALVIAAALAAVLGAAMCVLSFKYEDGILPVKNYYDLPEDTVDVLFIGSSHVGTNIDTQLMWQRGGTAAYKYWGSMQPVWNTYYYLVEALKTQTPKVVVVDVYGTLFDYELTDYACAVKNTMGMKLSQNKIENVMASFDSSNWATALLGLPAYHGRYTELTEKDFEYFPWNKHTDMQINASSGDTVYQVDILASNATRGTAPLTEKAEKYLRMVIEYCRDNNMPLELVASPFNLSQNEQQRLRTVAAIAEEYGVPFENFNDTYADIGIDEKTDFWDYGHLNDAGIEKYTTYLQDELVQKYDIPDRREDANHVWNTAISTEAEKLYTLENRFVGDGKKNYIDTGVKLYENPLASWTILAEVQVPRTVAEETVILSCYDENPDNYHGLLLNLHTNGGIEAKYDIIGSGEVFPSPGTVKLAIVKSGKEISYYADGVLVRTNTLDSITAYDGNLLIGCEQQPDGTKFRFSDITVYALEVYGEALDINSVAKWSPEWAPVAAGDNIETVTLANAKTETKLINTFEGDGLEKYEDMGGKLYDNPEKSWTLLAQISPDIEAGDNVYFSCFNEDPADYKGLLVRRSEAGKLNIIYGNGVGIYADIPQSGQSTLCIVKDASLYTIYLNGEKIVDAQSAPCSAYDGTLLVGCEVDENGAHYRYSGTTVYNLSVINGVLNEADILAWQPEAAPTAEPEQGVSVEYTLEQGFAGNGTSASVNTGAILYDTPYKSWTLSMQVDYDKTLTGTLLSCFAENPNNYRGLIVRQTDESTLGITAGVSYTEVSIPVGTVYTLTVVKDGYTYGFYLNGTLAATAESRCASYDGPLMLGCERTEAGQNFRYSTVKIRALRIIDGADYTEARRFYTKVI